jgi:hypothetical protein
MTALICALAIARQGGTVAQKHSQVTGLYIFKTAGNRSFAAFVQKVNGSLVMTGPVDKRPILVNGTVSNGSLTFDTQGNGTSMMTAPNGRLLFKIGVGTLDLSVQRDGQSIDVKGKRVPVAWICGNHKPAHAASSDKERAELSKSEHCAQWRVLRWP